MLAWGVLSTARIAEEFVRAVRADGHSTVKAVASRDASRAREWARGRGVERAFGSYEQLIESTEIDAVYIPLPNSMHAEWSIRALQAGKHVLVEKPMALTAGDVDQIFKAADESGRLVMEGFMFRHHPVYDRVLALTESGVLGQVVLVRSWHGFTVGDPKDIRFSAALGGGALLDLGCYCVAGTLLFIEGIPDGAVANQVMGGGGVDVSTQAILKFGAQSAVMDFSMAIPESAGLQVVGTESQVEIPQPWFPHLEPSFWLTDRDGRRQLIECPQGDSYALEIANFCRAVAGKEEPRVSRALSRRIARTLQLIASHARTMAEPAQRQVG